MEPIQSAGEAVPNISEEVDRLIDMFENTGARWYVIGGSRVIQPHLAFELSTLCNSTEASWRAMHDFAEAFARNKEIRTATIEFAINVGAYFVEIFNDKPVISDGGAVQ